MTDLIKTQGNLFKNLPTETLPNELCETLSENKHSKLQRIISTGQITPKDTWYDQPQDEWVILLKGQAELTFENNQKKSLKSGDYLLIPAHQKHRVSWTDPTEACVWLALYLEP